MKLLTLHYVEFQSESCVASDQHLKKKGKKEEN